MGKVFSIPEKPGIYGRRIMYEMEALGFNSIGLTAIISIFIGAVITLQMAINLESPFIPKYLIGYATRETMILEFSSTVVALILAGKVGSNIASEIGTMRITEQIDALEIMGVNSASYLILPKIVATVLFFPLLTLLSILIGTIGGYIIAAASKTPAKKAPAKKAPAKPAEKKSAEKAPAKPAPTVTPVDAPVVEPIVEAPAPAPVPEVAPEQEEVLPIQDGDEILPPAPVVEDVAPPVVQSDRVHVVKEGEDLMSISISWLVGLTELRALNGLDSSTMEVPVGTTLRIPMPANNK